jgi:hypothetical protein
MHPDANGMHVLNPELHRLRDDIRTYFEQRNEDSVDV